METSNETEPNEQEARPGAEDPGFDISLLEDSLAMTPLERMQANDDAVNFADSLQAAMRERDAKSD